MDLDNVCAIICQRTKRAFQCTKCFVVLSVGRNREFAAEILTRSSPDADNMLDAFSGQSRSTNMVPFHMLHIVSYCAIVTLSLKRAVFTIFVWKKFHDLEMGSRVTQGHWQWYHSI